MSVHDAVANVTQPVSKQVESNDTLECILFTRRQLLFIVRAMATRYAWSCDTASCLSYGCKNIKEEIVTNVFGQMVMVGAMTISMLCMLD